MNWKAFFEAAAVNGAVVQPFVIGLTTVWGLLGAKGKVQLVSGIGTGFVLGFLVQTASVGFPVGYAGWVGLGMFCVLCGLTAVGLYETGKKIASR